MQIQAQSSHLFTELSTVTHVVRHLIRSIGCRPWSSKLLSFRNDCHSIFCHWLSFVTVFSVPSCSLRWIQQPILDNPDNFVVYVYVAFILEPSYVATNNLPELNSFKSYFNRSFSKQRLFISRARFLVSLSTWCHRSQVFLVLKYCMFSSVNINAICVSCLSSSVYFSCALDKNCWRSSIAYHLFVNSATFVQGMQLFPRWWP